LELGNALLYNKTLKILSVANYVLKPYDLLALSIGLNHNSTLHTLKINFTTSNKLIDYSSNGFINLVNIKHLQMAPFTDCFSPLSEFLEKSNRLETIDFTGCNFLNTNELVMVITGF